MDSPLGPLRASAVRLHKRVQGLDDNQLEGQSYSSDWSIADVLSHLGSGAVIMRHNLENLLAGRPPTEDFAPSVWDVWNAKTPRAKADDGLIEDELLLEALEAVSEADRERLAFPMGPLSFSFDQAVAMRLNEHAFHSWDIEVALDKDARLPSDATAVVVDNLALIARFTAKPNGERRTVRLHTKEPERDFALRLAPDGVELAADDSRQEPDLVLPAEAFCRLVYGRLDPAHTPAVIDESALLDTLRTVFPGP